MKDSRNENICKTEFYNMIINSEDYKAIIDEKPIFEITFPLYIIDVDCEEVL